LKQTLHILEQEGLLDDAACSRIREDEASRLFSVHWHVKTLLYLGVTLVSAGFGLLIYKNIDTIGHLAIVIVIGLLSGGCFFYCIKNSYPFSRLKAASPGIGYDYILLLGCLLFITFLGYLQWQYLIFGFRYGLATFIPACLLLVTAYRFDHLGVLTLGLTLFASWLGLSITPLELLRYNDFSSERIIYTGAMLALIFTAVAWLQHRENFKMNFVFTYIHFAAHLAGISCLAGIFQLNTSIIWIPLLGMAMYALHRYSKHEKSFYLLLVSLFYGYFGAGYLFVKLMSVMPEVIAVYASFALFIGSSMWLIVYLKRTWKSFHRHDII